MIILHALLNFDWKTPLMAHSEGAELEQSYPDKGGLLYITLNIYFHWIRVDSSYRSVNSIYHDHNQSSILLE